MTFVREVTSGLARVPAGGGPAWWMAGDTYTVKLDAASTGGTLGLVEASIPPGSGPPPHRHAHEDETFYLLAGSLEVQANDDVVTATAGDVVFLPRGALHTFRNPGVDAARALIIITPAGFEGLFSQGGEPARPGEPPPTPGPDDIARLLAAAPRFGVELNPPPA